MSTVHLRVRNLESLWFGWPVFDSLDFFGSLQAGAFAGLGRLEGSSIPKKVLGGTSSRRSGVGLG